jgi:hypothetical protein
MIPPAYVAWLAGTAVESAGAAEKAVLNKVHKIQAEKRL